MADDHGQRIMTAAVYLLWCGPRRHLYCGWTTDVERRLAAHRAGKGAKYTSRYAAIELAAVLPMPDASAARREEARIKRLSRAEKLELVRALGPEPARALSPGTRTPAA